MLPSLERLPSPAATGACVNPYLPTTGPYAYLNSTNGLVPNDPKPGFPTEYSDATTKQLVRKDYRLHGRLTFLELYNAAGVVVFTRDWRQQGKCVDTVYAEDGSHTVVGLHGYSESS